MSSRDPARRIPKAMGNDTKLLGKYTLTDLAVGLFPGVLAVLVTQVLLPSSLRIGGYRVQTFTLPLAGVAIAIGALFVYLTPNYTTSIDWLGTFLRFQRSAKDLTHEDAKQYTQIERVHPERGAIERTDGTFIGLVRVDPPSMALATDEEWRSQAEAFQDFLNTTVEFPIQIYSTTRAFPADEYLSHYESRRSDPDVRANPRLAALIEQYVEWYRGELDERRMTIRDHYVVVPVAPEDVQFERESPLQQLARLPVLGVFVEAWFVPRIEEQREEMFDALEERLQRIAAGLRGIDGCNARPIEVGEAVRLIGEFWTGEPLEYGDMHRVLRTRPLVGVE